MFQSIFLPSPPLSFSPSLLLPSINWLHFEYHANGWRRQERDTGVLLTFLPPESIPHLYIFPSVFPVSFIFSPSAPLTLEKNPLMKIGQHSDVQSASSLAVDRGQNTTPHILWSTFHSLSGAGWWMLVMSFLRHFNEQPLFYQPPYEGHCRRHAGRSLGGAPRGRQG